MSDEDPFAYLTELEERVSKRFAEAAAARTPTWPVLDDIFDPTSWQTDTTPLPPDWPQFPRQQWVTYPTRRTVALLAADKLLDFPELTEEQWSTLCLVMLYGGRTAL